MMKTAEMKIEVSGGRVIDAKVMLDGCCVLTVELATTTATTENTTCQLCEGIFKKVLASELGLDDEFLKYQPKTDAERNFKKLVETAIKNGLKDFWRPVYDPSFDDNGRICYEPGKKPVVRKSYNWWNKNAKNFYPERGSRLGTKTEYIAFLAVLIKELVAFGKSIEWAWNAVCNDSKELGHYWNSGDSRQDFKPTGSREVCGWYDLANSYKILNEDEETGGFWLAGGAYCDFSYGNPLIGLYHLNFRNDTCYDGCGWLVLDSCPDC